MLKHVALNTVTNDAECPALLCESRDLPRTKRREGVFLAIESLHHKNSAAVRPPKHWRPRDPILDHSLRSLLELLRNKFTDRDLPRHAAGDPRSKQRAQPSRATVRGEMARADNRGSEERASCDCHSFRHGHVSMADILTPGLAERAEGRA